METQDNCQIMINLNTDAFEVEEGCENRQQNVRKYTEIRDLNKT